MPKPGYRAKSRDGAVLAKIRGKIWISKSGYQWVKLEAQTTATVSFGLFLARLNPGARLVMEQTRVNDEIWLPKREYMEHARGIWEELGLPAISPQSPWHGYSLGDWDERFDVYAKRAVEGQWAESGNETIKRRRGGLIPETPTRNVEGAAKTTRES